MIPKFVVVFSDATGALFIAQPGRELLTDDVGEIVETDAEYLDKVSTAIININPALAEVGRVHIDNYPDDSAVGTINDTDLGFTLPGINGSGVRKEFRTAWVWDGANIVIDPAKKRTRIIAKLRTMRNRQLKLSDVEIMIADEMGDAPSVTAWTDYRQALRDLPATVVGINTLAGIKIAWPVKPA